MKYAQLTPGQRVTVTPRGSRSVYHSKFIERLPKGVCVFIVDEFVGLTGADDIGDLYLADSEVRRRVKPVEAH
ncbi:hypothetical protein [Atlantibacter hermannii]|uniref:hypothetical protein n=1 Tax=Atlantibacter hermannii TaxID=565 RepID=UPI002896DAE8|nr:hypothetical protein [Atlantibacter hermannii]